MSVVHATNEKYTALTFEVTGYKDSAGVRQLIFNYEREKKVVQICATPDASLDQNVIVEMTPEEFRKFTKDLDQWSFLIEGMAL